MSNQRNSVSQERSKKDKGTKHDRCDACDFQKLKQLENNPVIRKLRDKIEQLNFRLTECKNENQMLKRNLQLAKKMVCQEVGTADVDFQDLLKHGTESGSKGRQENLLVLKTRVKELKDYLRELEGEQPPTHETASEEFVKQHMSRDRKKLWRVELERRLARENAEKDINPLVQECLELRRTLDAEKGRFRELNDEVKLLKAELQTQVMKNEEDFGIVKSFKTLQKQLEEILAERAEIRQHLNGSRARNKRLTDEILCLKEELQVLQKKTSDSNILIDSLTNSHKNIQEAIDFEKMIVQQNTERYKDELKILQENQVTDFEILDHLQCIIHDRNALVDELSKDFNTNEETEGEKKKAKNLKKVIAKINTDADPGASMDKQSEEDKTAIAENFVDDKNKVGSDQDIRKLKLECAKYKTLCEGAKLEGDGLSRLIAIQDQKMNEVAVQVVETGRLIMQKNEEKKEILEKVNKLQKSVSTKRRRGKFLSQSKSRMEELRIKCDAQKEENDFLRNFLRSTVCNKAKDLQKIITLIDDDKRFFDASLREIKELFESESQAQQDALFTAT